MKLLKSLSLTLLMAVVFIGCNKDDDKESSASLIGTWKLTAIKIDGQNEVLDACELENRVIFTSTTVKVKGYEGDTCEEYYEDEGTYSRNGNMLTVRFGDDVNTVEITKLTHTTLEITIRDIDGIEVETYTRE